MKALALLVFIPLQLLFVPVAIFGEASFMGTHDKRGPFMVVTELVT